MWFLLDDFSPSSDPQDWAGFYTGLRNVKLEPKPAYHVFADNTTLTLDAPASVAKGESVTLAGVWALPPPGPSWGRRSWCRAAPPPPNRGPR